MPSHQIIRYVDVVVVVVAVFVVVVVMVVLVLLLYSGIVWMVRIVVW
jgi:hypothetical protein